MTKRKSIFPWQPSGLVSLESESEPASLEVELDVVSGPMVVDVLTNVDAELDIDAELDVDRPRVELEPTPVELDPVATLVDPPSAIVVKSAVVAGSCR